MPAKSAQPTAAASKAKAAAPAKASKASAPSKAAAGAKSAAPAAKPSKASAPSKAAAPKPAAPKPAGSKAAAPKAAAPKAPVKPAAKPAAASNGVYVKNWGTGSVADAMEVFKAAGTVRKAQIRRHRYAIVFFENAASVKKAIDLFNEKEVLGTVVTVLPAKTTPRADPHENSSCVFVSPIFRASTTKQQILELFQGLKVLRLRTYRQNYAYVYLDSPAAALKFLQERNGTEFRGHKLRVALSTHSLAKLKSRYEAGKLLMAAHRHKKSTHTH